MICPDHPVRMERTSQGMPASIPFFIPNRRLLHITKSVCEPPIVTFPSFPAGNALSGKAAWEKKTCELPCGKIAISLFSRQAGTHNSRKENPEALLQYAHTEKTFGLPQGPENQNHPQSGWFALAL